MFLDLGALRKEMENEDQGLLYIGKAYDFRKRFQFHEIIAATMTLGGVTLSWLKLPGEFNTLCEKIFIAERAPRWNKQIPFRSIEHRMDRLNQQLRQEHAYDRGLRANEASDEEGEREETDIGKVICRYCDMEYMKRGLRRHQRTCDLRPSWERGRRDQGSH